jgi:outer membrane protein OmpA-like peptidoglycan-associated protein
VASKISDRYDQKKAGLAVVGAIMAVFRIRKESAWEWDTSYGAGGSAPIPKSLAPKLGGLSPTATWGYFRLKNKNSNRVELFNCVSLGLSYGIGGGKLPKWSVAGSLPVTPSNGHVFISDQLSGDDLEPDDFEGLCLVQEASIGLGFGGAGTVIFFAIPPAALPTTLLETGGLGSLIANYPEAFGGPLLGWLMDEIGGPQAMLNMYGTSHGVFGGASGSQSLGLITRGNVPSLSRTGDAPIMPEDVFSYLTPEDPSIRTAGAERAGGVIRISGDVLFSFGKSEFKTLKDATGQEVAATLQALEKVKKQIEKRSLRTAVIWGHTDNIRFKRGSHSNNQLLSEARARTMRSWLITRNVVSASKVLAYGAADREPIAPNTLAGGRQKNRRLDIYLFEQ